MGGPTPVKKTPAKRAPRPAKAAAPKPSRAKVVLDLDNLSKQKAFPDSKIPSVPFTFLLNGFDYELGDPRDTDWKLALELSSNPFLMMRTALVNADNPVQDPSDMEMRMCRQRHGLPQTAPPADTDLAREEAEEWPDGVTPTMIDRFAAADLPSWKLNALFAGWHEHYQIDLSSSRGVLAALLGRDE